MTLDDYFAANQANWDDRVPIHVASRSYDVPAFLAGRSSLRDVDIYEAGDVRDKTLLHLQCHFGMDTLSWAREGALVTGLDFSEAAVAAARDLGRQGGIDARFVQANVYDASTALAGEQFDVVFTGVGALCWLPDIRGWARIVSSLLKPGGALYIREGHPMLWALEAERDDTALVVGFPYFETARPTGWADATTYTDNATSMTVAHPQSYEWNHGLGEIVTALIEAGLRIEFVHEWDYCEWQALPWMVEDADGKWRLPEGPERLPLMYSMRATKD